MNLEDLDACQNCGYVFVKKLITCYRLFSIKYFTCPICQHIIEVKNEKISESTSKEK